MTPSPLPNNPAPPMPIQPEYSPASSGNTGNPVLDEISAAHASLSPQAQQAIEGAHGMLGISPAHSDPALAASVAPSPELAVPGVSGPRGPLPDLSPQIPAPSRPMSASPFPSVGMVAGDPDQAGALLAQNRAPSADQSESEIPMMAGPQRSIQPDMASVASTPPMPVNPHQAEFERLTKPPLNPSENASAHTNADSGRPGYEQIHNPWLRGLATAGNVIASGVFPRFGQFIPGTSGYHDNLVANQKGAVGEEQEGAKSAADVARTESQTKLENQQADTMAAEGKRAPKGNYITVGDGLYNASTGSWEREPTDKDKEKLVPIDPEFAAAHHVQASADGKFYIPQAAVSELFKEKAPTNEMEKFFTDKPDATSEDWEKFKTAHPKPMEWSASDAAILHAVGGDPSRPETQTFEVMKKFADLKKEHISVGADHGVSVIDPKTNQLVRVEPGQVAPVGFTTPNQSGQQSAPTVQQRNVAGQAQLVHEQMPEVIKNIDKLKDQLGPIAGRWNDFMQGKVGTDNPDFASLRADLLMMSSAVALMHARGRLPENLREEFDHAINAPKQTPENLKAVLNKIDQWTTKSMELGGKKPNDTALPGGVTLEDVDKELARRKGAK